MREWLKDRDVWYDKLNPTRISIDCTCRYGHVQKQITEKRGRNTFARRRLECRSCSDHILTSFVICHWTDARQLAIYLLTWLKFPKWYDINLVKYWEYSRLFCSPVRQHTTVSSDTRDLKQSRRQRHPRHRSKKNEFLFLVRISQMAGRVYHLLSCLTSTPA